VKYELQNYTLPWETGDGIVVPNIDETDFVIAFVVEPTMERVGLLWKLSGRDQEYRAGFSLKDGRFSYAGTRYEDDPAQQQVMNRIAEWLDLGGYKDLVFWAPYISVIARLKLGPDKLGYDHDLVLKWAYELDDDNQRMMAVNLAWGDEDLTIEQIDKIVRAAFQ
jgi:hypothetical protein